NPLANPCHSLDFAQLLLYDIACTPPGNRLALLPYGCPKRRSMRLLSTTIEKLKLEPGERDKIWFDDDGPGFGLRVRDTGSRSWVYQCKIGGKARRLVLGRAKAIKPGRAREIAGELHAKVKLGGDPAAEKQEKVYRAGDTFGLLAARFLEQYHRRPRTEYEIRRHLEKYAAPLHSAPVDSIGLRDIAGLLAQIAKAHGPVLANRVRATLSGCF